MLRKLSMTGFFNGRVISMCGLCNSLITLSRAEEKLMWLSGHPQGAIEIL
jgi:hypothetical protein